MNGNSMPRDEDSVKASENVISSTKAARYIAFASSIGFASSVGRFFTTRVQHLNRIPFTIVGSAISTFTLAGSIAVLYYENKLDSAEFDYVRNPYKPRTVLIYGGMGPWDENQPPVPPQPDNESRATAEHRIVAKYLSSDPDRHSSRVG